MDSNIVFKLSNNTIYISSMKRETDIDLNNTNVIDVKELKFSTLYIRENFELVSSFLNVAIIKKNINTACINNIDVASISMDLINEFEHITKLIFKPDKKLDFDVCLKLLDNDYLTHVECYDMSPLMISRLDVNKNLKIKTRNHIKLETNFSALNMLNSYSDIYYKKAIIISGEFKENDIDDLKTFIYINARLKYIKIVSYSNEVLTTIIEELKSYNRKNIVIEINEKNNDLNSIYNTVNYLKKKYKNYFDEYKIRFKLNYSNEYKSNNFVKEINFKMCATIVSFIIILSLIIVGLNTYQNKVDQNKVLDTMDIINSIIDDATLKEDVTPVIPDLPDVPDITEPTTEITTTSRVDPVYYVNYEQVFESLKSINKDTVGWLKVNNSNIDYPVVQSSNNSYYLNHDFNKKKNSMGWIFMDYRNNSKELDRNTIIYGHNVKEGIMFGTIKNVLNPSMNSIKENQIITFNTPDENMKWQVFSVYRVPATSDYLATKFDTDEDFLKFIELVKGRSKKNFGVEVLVDDKILTLSTCSSNNTRNVVHAVLIKEKTVEEVVND